MKEFILSGRLLIKGGEFLENKTNHNVEQIPHLSRRGGLTELKVGTGWLFKKESTNSPSGRTGILSGRLQSVRLIKRAEASSVCF